MPVRKFRSIEEMPCDHWLPAGEAQLWRAIEAVWGFALAASGMRFPPGVYKHRNLEEADRLRAEWETSAVRRRASGSGGR